MIVGQSFDLHIFLAYVVLKHCRALCRLDSTSREMSDIPK